MERKKGELIFQAMYDPNCRSACLILHAVSLSDLESIRNISDSLPLPAFAVLICSRYNDDMMSASSQRLAELILM